MARARTITGTEVTPIAGGWSFAPSPAGKIVDPAALEGAQLDWTPCDVPSTAASALRAAGRWSLDDRVDFDATDWWWRVRFAAPEAPAGAPRVLRFAGIATLADVWLNGQPLLRTDNMFVEHEADIGSALRRENELVIRCASIGAALQARRPRPRWRTRLVEATQLRWFRTALFGRIPAWAPAAAPVGPWRPVTLEDRSELAIVRADLRPWVDGQDGVVDAEITFDVVGGARPSRVTLTVGDEVDWLDCVEGDRPGRYTATGTTRVTAAALWWPHTHGTPARYPVQATIEAGDRATQVDFGRVGFRTVEASHGGTWGDGFALRVNDASIFCRGACWTPLDPAALIGADAAYRATLTAVRDAGMNMVRVCGPFFYEADAFYETCDDLGILVWHDYAFANMDYPADDPSFVANVEREARGFLDRTQLCCALAVTCGNSEAEQQAAMMGAPRALWRSPIFEQVLRECTRAVRPDVPYWPSTPSGGPLPFSTDAGTAHYFGVGAYLRPLEDARRADVRFTTECLAFANVPEDALLDTWLRNATAPQSPAWKQRTPRDSGVGWDFDDVRDHYLKTLFGVDPAALRYADVPRYLALSRVVTGEVMAATMAEWRRAGSSCHGALVWFLRDLWPGAGWGILDSNGDPKAPYWFLRRALRPTTVLLVDEGLNGLDVHALNDRPRALAGEVRVALYRGETAVARASVPVDVNAHDAARVRLAEAFEHFVDATYAYRFGPPAHDVAVATLVDRATGAAIADAFHFPRGLPSHEEPEVGLEAVAERTADREWTLRLKTRRLAQAIAIDVPGFGLEDNHLHLCPGATREIKLRCRGADQPPRGTARPLNAQAVTKIAIGKTETPANV